MDANGLTLSLFPDADGPTPAPVVEDAGAVAVESPAPDDGAAPALVSLALSRVGIRTDCHPAGRTFEEAGTGRRVVVTRDNGFHVDPRWTAPARPVRNARVDFLRVPGLDTSGSLVDGVRRGSMLREDFVERFVPTPATLAYQRRKARARQVPPLDTYAFLPVPVYP